MAAALYGEGSSVNVNLEEMQGIGDVIKNRAESMDTIAAYIIMETDQVKGYNSTSRNAVSKGRYSNDNEKLNVARAATMTTFLGTSRGKSNGAYWWDGADIAITDPADKLFNKFRRSSGFTIDSAHNIYNIGNVYTKQVTTYYDNGNPRGSYDHVYESTAGIGGTVFWKKSPEFKAASNRKEYP